MKKIVTAALLGTFATLAPLSLAIAGKHNMAGCGLGASLFEEDTTGSQILGATTNGSSGNQTFGISSGTSGCTSDGVVKKAKAQSVYVDVNFASVSQDMASGGGEYLSALGGLLGCGKGSLPMLSELAQRRYDKIIPSENTDAQAMLVNLKAEMAAEPALARSCEAIRPARTIAGAKLRKVAAAK